MSDEDLQVYKDKAPTPLQARMADWIIEEEELYAPATKKEESAFREGVRLGVALRMIFQASDYNREATAKLRSEKAQRLQEAAEERATAKAAAKAAAKEEASPEGEVSAKKTAKKTAAAAPAAASPAEGTARRGGRRRQPATEAAF